MNNFKIIIEVLLILIVCIPFGLYISDFNPIVSILSVCSVIIFIFYLMQHIK